MRLWMLRIHYERGSHFGDESHGNKEFRGYNSRIQVDGLIASILELGFIDHSGEYKTPRHSGLTYEYWVAPYQVLGWEIIEYVD